MGKFITFLLIFITVGGHSQTGVWKWVNGFDAINLKGSYGIKGVADITNIPAARESGTSWTDTSGNLWLFGGRHYSITGNYDERSDLWKYDPLNNAWTWINGSNLTNQSGVYTTVGTPDPANAPGARDWPLSWTDKANNLWMFGGVGIDGNSNWGELNDIWKYIPALNQWEWVSGSKFASQPGNYGIKGVADRNNTPGGRDAAMHWIDSAGNLWLFGGEGIDAFGNYGRLNDLWKYDINTSEWTWISGGNIINQQGTYGTRGVPSSDNYPGTRWSSACWTDSAGNFWLFGGFGEDDIGAAGFLNDLWEYLPSQNKWVWKTGANVGGTQYGIYGIPNVPNSTNTPGSRHWSTSWTDFNGNLWLFGGEGYSPSSRWIGWLNDMWKYDINTNEWVWVKGSYVGGSPGVYGMQGVNSISNMPGSRSGAFNWTDKSSHFWLFGGLGINSKGEIGYLNDMWQFTFKPDLGNDTSILVCPGTFTDVTASYDTSAYGSVKWSIQSGDSTVDPEMLKAGDYELIASYAVGLPDTVLITISQNAPVVADSPQIIFANKELTDPSGWTNYYHDSILVLSIKKNGNRIGSIGDGTFSVKLVATKKAGSGLGTKITNTLVTNTSGFWSMNRYWEVVPTREPATPVGVRFYFNDADFNDVKGSVPSLTNKQQLQFYKLTGGNPNPDSNWIGATAVIPILNGDTAGTTTWLYNNMGCSVNSAEYLVESFPGGGGGGAGNGLLLPLQLISFTANRAGSTNILEWKTATDLNTSLFDIERSRNNNNFTVIGTLSSKETGNTITSYTFTDNKPYNGINYYRLKIIDRDHHFLYSAVRSVNNTAGFKLVIYPNPVVTRSLTLKANSEKPIKIQIEILNAEGKIMLSNQLQLMQGISLQTINVSHLSNGNYFIRCVSAEKTTVLKFIKQS